MNRDPLSILHFSTADQLGGSAKAANRIHQGLKKLGHESRMLVRYKESNDLNIETIWPTAPYSFLDRISEIACKRSGFQYLYVPSSKRALRHRWFREANIIQLYNLHGAYLSPLVLPKLSQQAPIIWRLSDIWPATGHCAYSGSCERWKVGCGKCPDLNAYPPVSLDFTAFLWRLKNASYKKSDITLVAPSSWAENIARLSPLLRDFPLIRIPTGVDLFEYNLKVRERFKNCSREKMNIKKDAVVILFAAHVLDDHSRKGGQHLIEALQIIGNIPNCVVVLAGMGGEKLAEKLPVQCRLAGYIKDPKEMAKVYAVADISVVPSTDENLANTALEAMACGLPVVAFDSGGMKDAIKHLETGYLAVPGNSDDLAKGIKLFLDDDEKRINVGQAANELIHREFGINLQAERFSDLYHEVLRRSS